MGAVLTRTAPSHDLRSRPSIAWKLRVSAAGGCQGRPEGPPPLAVAILDSPLPPKNSHPCARRTGPRRKAHRPALPSCASGRQRARGAARRERRGALHHPLSVVQDDARLRPTRSTVRNRLRRGRSPVDAAAVPGFPLTRSRFQRERASPARGEAGVSVVQDDAGPRIKPGAEWRGLGLGGSPARPIASGASLERDDFSSSRHPALSLCLSMIFSENR